MGLRGADYSLGGPIVRLAIFNGDGTQRAGVTLGYAKKCVLRPPLGQEPRADLPVIKRTQLLRRVLLPEGKFEHSGIGVPDPERNKRSGPYLKTLPLLEAEGNHGSNRFARGL
jgi:hypothetical protein